MKKRLLRSGLLLGALFLAAQTSQAGGLMTNTNYHIAFDRMMARGASFDIDAVYSNPAGLAWGHEGWQLSFNIQKPFQYRDIEASIPQPYATAIGFEQHKFKGKASANPFVPALFASYKHDRWAFGFMAGIVGSGGKVKYDEGVPSFVVPVSGLLASNGVTPGAYTMDAFMEGKQYIYGIQANATYRINDHWAVAAGLRVNIYDGYNCGHVVATLNSPGVELVNLQIDADQRGAGVCPFLSVNYRLKRLVLTGRYEFRSKLNIPNDTKTLDAKIINPASLATGAPSYLPQAAVLAQFGDKVAPYMDGVKTRYDMPGLLSLAAGYEFIPNKLRGTLEYHWFDDKHAKMGGDRQETLTRGTHEFLAGVEWDINERFTVSLGGQRTDYGISPEYQSNTSFACDSYSVGVGGAVNITKHLRLNLGYFCSIYSNNSKDANYSGIPVTETYSRTNHVLGIGADYKF